MKKRRVALAAVLLCLFVGCGRQQQMAGKRVSAMPGVSFSVPEHWTQSVSGRQEGGRKASVTDLEATDQEQEGLTFHLPGAVAIIERLTGGMSLESNMFENAF